MLEAIILVCKRFLHGMLILTTRKKSLLEFTIRKITKQNFFFQDLLAFWRGDTNFHPALVVSATVYWSLDLRRPPKDSRYKNLVLST